MRALGSGPTLMAALALTGCGDADPAVADEPAPTLEAPLEASGERYTIELRSVPAPPRTGELFELRTSVARRDGRPVTGARITVDATMPHHGHGMVTRPSHSEVGDGSYLSEGMKLHMPGRWRLEVVVSEDAREETIALWVEQPP